MKHVFAAGAVLGVVCLGAGAVRGAQSPAAGGVTDTAVVFGIEEQVNSFSTDEENLGFRLAFQEANDAGPIHGRRITWKGYPRGGGDAAAEAVANATRLVDVDGVLALVNWGGPQSIALLKLAASRRVPYLFPHTALISSEGQRYLFTSFPRFEGEAAVMFPYLARERKLTRVGLVHDVNAYGQLFKERLTALAPTSGYTVVGSLPIDSRDPGDVAAGLRHLVDAGATAVVMALYPAQAKKVVEAKGTLGWKGTLVSTGPLTDEQFLNVPGNHANGALGFCYYPDPDTSAEPGVAAYRAAMTRYHAGRPRNRYSLYGYVYGRLVVEGLRRAGRELTRDRLVEALESIRDWDAGGTMPPVSFSPTDHHAQPAGFVCELENGRFKALSGWIEPGASPAAPAPSIETTPVATGLRHPWSMAFLPGGDFLVTEKDGGFARVTPAGRITPIAGAPADLDNVRQIAADNSGLFDVVLHPAFATNQRLYFTYAAKTADGTTTRLATARLVGDTLVETRPLFDATPRSAVRHHYGGALLIGNDGLLYFTVGERHFNERDNPPLPAAQDPADRRGKVYRFTLDGAPAPGNPTFGAAAAPGLFATGVRASQGLAQDPASGRIWMTDHGPVSGDEINLLAPGANYGWPVRMSGRYRNQEYVPAQTLPAATYRDPAFAWTDRTVAPAGLVVYSGTEFPEWRGDLIVAGLGRGHLLRVDVDGDRLVRADDVMASAPVRLRNVKQAPDGTLYLLTDERDGRLLKVRRGISPTVPPGR